MAVGQSILTVKGSYALADASSTGKSIKPKYYKVSNQDIALDPTLIDLSGVWKTADISGYFPINDNTVEFLVDIPPEEATSYGKTFGLYLEDGTLFMIAKPPYPFPPQLRQTFKIQLVYNNANNLIDFQYIPFYETEQDLNLIETTMFISDILHQHRNEIEQIKSTNSSLWKFAKNTNLKLQKTALSDLSNVDEKKVLEKIKAVDGLGSGLDADMVRGLDAVFDNSLSTSGFQKLPGGLEIKWGLGSGTLPANTQLLANFKTVSYPTPFSTKTLFVIVTRRGTLGASRRSLFTARGFSKTGFIIDLYTVQSYPTDQIVDYRWLALGY